MGGLKLQYNLDLSFNGFVGVIPSELPMSLSNMTLSSNFLIGTLPTNLSGLRGLGVLDLWGNKLRDSIDTFLFSHPEMQQLNLPRNSYTTNNVPNMSRVRSLIVGVDIDLNRISGLLPSNFSTLESISILKIK